jgi:hypothetical protein
VPLSPIPNYPTSLDSLPDPTTAQFEDDDGFEIDLLLQKLNAIAEALEAKLGIGSSTAAAAQALFGNAAGTTKFDTIARRNLLLNGDMRVKQLGTLGSTDNSHVVDGWRLLLEAANAAVATQDLAFAITGASQYALKLTVGSGNNNKFGAVQVIEGANCSHLRGKVVSIQAMLAATAGIGDVKMAIVESTNTIDTGAANVDIVSTWNAAGTAPTLAAGFSYLGTPANLSVGAGEIHRLPALGTVGASTNNLLAFVWSDDKTTTLTTDALYITDVQVEEGSVCSAFERRPIAEDMLRARTRYQQSYANGTATGTASTNGSHYVLISDNTNAKFTTVPVYFSPPMRAAPTMSYWDAAGNASKLTTYNAAGTGTDNVTPSIGFNGTTTQQAKMLHSGSVAGSSFHWAADSRM